MTDEIVVMLIGSLLHVPFWFFILMMVDIKKGGGKTSDVFNFLRKKKDDVREQVCEPSDVGENEDQDVKAERQKVAELINCHTLNPPVVMVHVGIACRVTIVILLRYVLIAVVFLVNFLEPAQGLHEKRNKTLRVLL